MSQTPISSSSAQFVPNRERKSSVANSVKFNHARSSSISSIDEELLQPPSRIMNHERGSFESLSSNRTSILDEIDSPNRSQQQLTTPRASSLFFKNVNTSSSTLLPLTRTVSFNSIQGLTTPTSGSSPDTASTNDTSSKPNRLSRLFSSRHKASSVSANDIKTAAPPRGSFSPKNPNRPTISGNINNNGANGNSSLSLSKNSSSKTNLLQRQMSLGRSIKEKRNLKKPVDLSIQTSNLNPTIMERGSPLTRNNSELIDGETLSGLPNLTEALGSTMSMTSPQLATSSSSNNISKAHKHHHHHLHLNHHNLLRPRNKDNPLSSSSSNSKLISDKGETFYSFSMTGGNFSTSDLQRTFQQLESLNYKDLDFFADKDVMGDECYALLSFLILPIFKGDPLKVPIEDLNRLVHLFLYLRIQEFHLTGTPTKTTASNASWSSHHSLTVFDEILMLFEQGFKKFNDHYTSKFKNISTELKVAKSWNYFQNNILYYIEGIFLPLQLELQGIGSLIKHETYIQIWRELTLQNNLENLYIKRLILSSFRDFVIIPIYENDEEENWIHEDDDTRSSIDGDDDKKRETISIIQQCFSMLKSIESNDSSQNLIERLLKDILENSSFK